MTTDERELLARLDEAEREISAAVERLLPGWVVREVDRILDAWGRFDASTRAAIRARAEDVGREVAHSVRIDLDELFAEPPEAQRVTPLQVIRRAAQGPTALLVELGVPPVVRDAFDERAHPDDDYDLVPRRIGDLGDPDLGPVLLAWGLTQAHLARSRRDQA